VDARLRRCAFARVLLRKVPKAEPQHERAEMGHFQGVIAASDRRYKKYELDSVAARLYRLRIRERTVD
jgi:hypothetical protein